MTERGTEEDNVRRVQCTDLVAYDEHSAEVTESCHSLLSSDARTGAADYAQEQNTPIGQLDKLGQGDVASSVQVVVKHNPYAASDSFVGVLQFRLHQFGWTFMQNRPPSLPFGAREQAWSEGLFVYSAKGLPKQLSRERAEAVILRISAETNFFAGCWPVMLWGDEPGHRINNPDKRQEAGDGARGRPSTFGQWEMAFRTPLPLASPTHELRLPNAWWSDVLGAHPAAVAPVLSLELAKQRNRGHRKGIG